MVMFCIGVRFRIYKAVLQTFQKPDIFSFHFLLNIGFMYLAYQVTSLNFHEHEQVQSSEFLQNFE